jgi:hypothetical protein
MSIRPEHRKTFPKARLPETLLMFMRLHGGTQAAVDPKFTYDPLADYFELPQTTREISRNDYYTDDPKPGRAWDREVQWAARELKSDGYALRTVRSGRTVWSLTTDGVTRADFWLIRLTAKTAALKALVVDAQLASQETAEQPKELAS